MNKIVTSALALTLSAGLVGTAVPAHADPITKPVGADAAPAAGAAAYLAAQAGTGHVLKTYYEYPAGSGSVFSYDDYGLTIDGAWALDAVGGQGAELESMTDTIATNLTTYAGSGGTKAKASAFLLSQGVASNDVLDEVEDIEDDHLGTASPITGRLIDADDPGTDYDDDFNSPLTQAFAVSALNNAGSDQANSVLAFLLQQQCTAGFFRSDFSPKADVDQSCDGATGPAQTPSIDTTATALLMLQDQKSKPVVKTAITKALAWLESVQAANGSFSNGNANATGLAGWVLGLGGKTASAAKAAGWLRAHQLANAGGCTPFAAADKGAVVLNDLAYTNAQAGALDALDNSTATRATTQALPALLWAPGGANAGAFTLTGPTGFVPAGSAQQYSVKGAPGDTVCVNGAKVVLDVSGQGTASVTAPATTSNLSVTAVDAGGETHAAVLKTLAATTLELKVRTAVANGSTFSVKVVGLAPGEPVTLSFAGTKTTATAKSNGKARFKVVATRVGQAKIKAVGAFKNRKVKATVTVTR